MAVMPPWRMPPPEVVGECPPHRVKYVDGRAIWSRVCPNCALGQMSALGPILTWTHYCHRALGHTVIVIWWPNDRYERTAMELEIKPTTKFCPDCSGKGCGNCGGTGTVDA